MTLPKLQNSNLRFAVGTCTLYLGLRKTLNGGYIKMIQKVTTLVIKMLAKCRVHLIWPYVGGFLPPTFHLVNITLLKVDHANPRHFYITVIEFSITCPNL
jgi:hypothetical protein